VTVANDAVARRDEPSVSRSTRWLVYAAAFGCAGCGLAYELVLISLGSSLIGDTVVQTSLVISTMVFAMGVGALIAKRLLSRAAEAFVFCEPLIAVIGGLSPALLLAAFAWMDTYEPLLLIVSFIIGALVGAEIPMLLVLVPQRSDGSFAELLAADYLGALGAGIAIPFFIVPNFGLVEGAMVVGAINLLMGLVVLFGPARSALRASVRRSAIGCSIVAALLLLGGVIYAPRFERSARQQLFEDPIVVSKRTKYQEIVVTEDPAFSGPRDLRLFLNGDLQFSSIDEYRYHEALVHPVMSGPHKRVAILGGGDGLALREVLRYGDVESVTLVELDADMVQLAQTDARFRRLNKRAFDDPRVKTVVADAFTYTRKFSAKTPRFDTVIVDFPDPDSLSLAKLYSVEFYTMAQHLLTPNGRMVVQAGSPGFATRAFWCINASITEAGFKVVPYHVDVPSFGSWGFMMASRSAPTLTFTKATPKLRSMDQKSLQAAAVFAPDRVRTDVRASTLSRPTIVDYEAEGWKNY
jgi:spermidine synthase